MGFNLPPSGGNNNNNNNNNVIGQVLSGALTVGAIVLFFASPLGAIFFAITNSIFLLVLIAPVVLTVAFQIWKSLNTIEGVCPNCGAPNQRVLKDPAQVSFCFNCGALLQASPDAKRIELSTAPTRRSSGGDFIDLDNNNDDPLQQSGTIFDQFFGGGQPQSSSSSSRQQPSPSSIKEKEQKFRREQTVIDVEVDNDDK